MPAAAAPDSVSPSAAEPDTAPPEPAPRLVTITSSSPEAIAEYARAATLIYDQRLEESMSHLRRALELDPTFLRARALLAFFTPGPEGLAALEKSNADASSLPVAERLWIEACLADRKGDWDRASELERRIAEVAPDDWRAHFEVGRRALRRNDVDAALPSLERAARLAPEVGVVHNIVGYAHLYRGEKREAIAAFRRYAELSPADANPHDSLGEALLAAGELEEAEAEFEKAVAISPTMDAVWEGIAVARALRGNWQGAGQAMERGLAASSVPATRLALPQRMAWIRAASGDVAGALDALAALERAGDDARVPAVALGAVVDRARLLLEEDRLDELAKALTAAAERTKGSADHDAAMTIARCTQASLEARLAARQGRPDDAQRALGALDELLKSAPDDPTTRSLGAATRGIIRIASDPAVAANELASCAPVSTLCRWHEVRARERAGDTEGAARAKQALVDWPLRSVDYVYARARLGTIPAAPLE